MYFSGQGGLAESRHVFLDHNHLAERWRALPPGGDFVIGETGFGTGLNFLAAWQLWRNTAPRDGMLHFISVERHPLTRPDLERALARFPELGDQASALLAAWPADLCRGCHRLPLAGGRLRLTLVLDEALSGLESLLDSAHPAHRRLRRGVDAWFLDGFAPSRNPDMWRPELLETLGAMSAPGATFATFTAAGAVRRGLAAAGFTVHTAPGFGHKRDMLYGCLEQAPALPAVSDFKTSPYPNGLEQPWHVDRTAPRPPHRAVVVGGGLAGCHAARALADRGLDVTLIEAREDLAQGGSGNEQGVLYARLSAHHGHSARFNLAALLFALRHYAPFWGDPEQRFGAACGVLHLAGGERERRHQAVIAERHGRQGLCQLLDREAASELAGMDLPGGGLWFQQSGWLAPPGICRSLVQHPNIRVRQGHVRRLDKQQNNWLLHDEHDEVLARAPLVVLACAHQLDGFAATVGLPIQPVRGQVSRVLLDQAPAARALRTALCGDGYLAPPADGALCFGASFLPDDADTSLRTAEHVENLARLRQQVPGLLPADLEASACSGRAAVRCATRDRLPLVGPVPDAPVMAARYQLLGKNARAAIAAPGAVLPGLYVSAGYGSRGLAYIPLCTELLMAAMLGEPPPLDRALRRALHPARFLVRDLARGSA